MNRWTFPTSLAITAVAALSLSGCAHPPGGHGTGQGAAMAHMHAMKGQLAVASLSPTVGNNTRGLVIFHQDGEHLRVHVKISGLKPGSEHGFHVHENGNCASPDGLSAGGHFNPDGKPHGPQGADHHAGDMPALKADANGQVDLHVMLMGPSVKPGAASVVGRSVIVHAQPDDYSTQPTGNSGARIACGVIAGY